MVSKKKGIKNGVIWFPHGGDLSPLMENGGFLGSPPQDSLDQSRGGSPAPMLGGEAKQMYPSRLVYLNYLYLTKHMYFDVFLYTFFHVTCIFRHLDVGFQQD